MERSALVPGFIFESEGVSRTELPGPKQTASSKGFFDKPPAGPAERDRGADQDDLGLKGMGSSRPRVV